MSSTKPKIWTPGDFNAFFGFGTNILVNLLVLTGLLRFVLKMPDDIVFHRILPATGMMLFLSTVYYAFLAYRLAKSTGRTDVCALPSGISVPHMFIVTFVIMLPIALKTGDPVQGWEAGLTWVFVQSFVLMGGGFCFSIILASWFGGVKYKGVPAGLVAIAVGSAIAWISAAAGWGFGGMSLDNLSKSVANFGFSLPIPAFGHVFHGFKYLGVIL